MKSIYTRHYDQAAVAPWSTVLPQFVATYFFEEERSAIPRSMYDTYVCVHRIAKLYFFE